MDYLAKRSWSNETVNKLMAWMTDNQASGEDGAKHFLKENKDMYGPSGFARSSREDRSCSLIVDSAVRFCAPPPMCR
jgi:hypothetical protein